MAIFDEQELRLLKTGLKIASTYCNLAETESLQRHWRDEQRLLQKAQKEIDVVKRHLQTHVVGLETSREILSGIQEIERRIESLTEQAA